MKILIIEDYQPKIEELTNLIEENFEEVEIIVAHSYNSGLRELIRNGNSYKLVLLDMSMPNYDIKVEEGGGGEPLPKAGELLLREIDRRDIETEVIIVTMYEHFEGGDSLTGLHQSFQRLFSKHYKGYVIYNSSETLWKDNLLAFVKNYRKIND
jgi:CheY-like chemotaxis protein